MIGKYQAAEARKKAYSLQKDIVLINPASDPVICKISDFRDEVIGRFYT